MRGASVTEVAKRAGVSPQTYKRHFECPDDCFMALIDWMLERVVSAMIEAFEREPTWSDGVVAALEALLGVLDREPVRARACLLEGMAASSSRLDSSVDALGALSARAHERARQELPPESHPPAAMAEATIGSVLGLLRRRILKREAPPFGPLLCELAEVVVMSYAGPEAAARVARAGRERSRATENGDARSAVSPRVKLPKLLRRANAHRMRSCVRFLAENPGASNKAVAAAIGVPHLGQTSVLLARLKGAGLLEKKTGGPGRPNAWRLSPQGAEIASALGNG